MPLRLISGVVKVHGTCLGMETLCIVLSENYTILSQFDAEDAAAPLLYTDMADTSHLIRRSVM